MSRSTTRIRKSHLKSRNGCFNCKKRHVKCDEQGPPCANCTSRDVASSCEYYTTSESRSVFPHGQTSFNAHDPATRVAHGLPLLGAPSDFNTLLQLELMHRWSTSTYLSFVTVPPDVQFMQISVPRGALEHSFLLNGMMAISALEIASTGHQQAAYYFRRVMEFYDQSSGSFRAHLEQSNNETPEWMFLHSYIVSLINLGLASASNPEARCSIEATMTMFELYIGTAMIGMKNAAKLTTGLYGSSVSYAIKSVFAPVPSSLDPATEECFKGLRTLVENLSNNPQYIRMAGTPMLLPSWQVLYQHAIPQLYRCFLEEEKQMMSGSCLMFPVMIGPDFVHCVRERDPMALVILMIWATLLDRMADVAWWAKNLGVKLVVETTEELLLQEVTGISALPEFYNCITYAHEQLGTRVPSDLIWSVQPTGPVEGLDACSDADNQSFIDTHSGDYLVAIRSLRALALTS